MTENTSNEQEAQSKKTTLKLRLNIGHCKKKEQIVESFPLQDKKCLELEKKASSTIFNSIPINSKKPKTLESNKRSPPPPPPPIIPQSRLIHLPSSSSSSSSYSSVTSSAISLYLAEREEERAYKTTIQESLLKYTRQISHPSNWDFPINATIQSTIDAVLPFWILCSNLSISKNNYLQTQNISLPIAKNDLLKRLDEIENTFNNYIKSQKERPISSELSLLEQRLCLEEERYLYAKLKNEYNIHINEILKEKQRKKENNN